MRQRATTKKVRSLSYGTLQTLLLSFIALCALSAQTFPNIPLKTMGGKQFWQDVYLYGGWRIQFNTLSEHYRLLDIGDTRRAWGSRNDCEEALNSAKQSGKATLRGKELCLLIHGYGRSKDSFSGLSEALLSAGYEVYDLNYPSTQSGIAEIGDYVAQLYQAVEGDFAEVHVITHSMGGLVVRYALTHIAGPCRGKLILIAAPNQGAVMADKLLKRGPLAWIGGPSTKDLQTGMKSLVQELGMPSCPCGVIAGVRGDGEGWNPLIPGDDDGLVGVDETQVEGMNDFIRVEAMHTFIMNAPETVDAVLHFLKTRRFSD